LLGRPGQGSFSFRCLLAGFFRSFRLVCLFFLFFFLLFLLPCPPLRSGGRICWRDCLFFFFLIHRVSRGLIEGRLFFVVASPLFFCSSWAVRRGLFSCPFYLLPYLATTSSFSCAFTLSLGGRGTFPQLFPFFFRCGPPIRHFTFFLSDWLGIFFPWAHIF